ncbi:MAG TPA: CDP-diacylglycerol--serine O-phosphatidyltransferase [Cytophagales bacterium]|nr:CDP-diacylglycerol--serine O-phosphatidyltransferase [Cytophagales bacterium]
MSQIRLFTPPNVVTLANLTCGIVGIQQVFSGSLIVATYCIYFAALFDFLDGFVARQFKSSSELGKQLDSLSDVVSFGLLPGFLIFYLLGEYKWFSIIVPLFSALRLAKFNIDSRQKQGFIGVPTPINALFVSSLTFVFQGNVVVQEINYLLILLVLFSSIMLVVEMPLLDIKFEHFQLRENAYRYLFLLLSLLFTVFLKWGCFIPIYFLYLLLSLIQNITSKYKNEIHS